jgi:ribonuclease Y
MLIDAMYHGSTEYVAEFTISTVKIADDDVKGRIIGKEGRNIRTFEKVTGVDIDMDETPGEVRLSCYDGVRREVARVALERLIKDGRIQPTRIEEYVQKARHDIEKIMYEEGKKLCHMVGAYNLPTDLIAALGRFKFRSSYGQNMLAHTLEETRIGMNLAAETHANVDIVRLGCLFHDIGKIITDVEGSHVDLGVDLLKKYNMPQAVIDCVAQHHEDVEFTSKESILVYISDAISGSRPGARYENVAEYVKRLKAIEEIAMSKNGVSEAYAISAGREVRVMVDPGKATDDEAVRLASDIRDEIKAKLTYPGTVTVTVIRETRAQQVAK